MSTSDLQPYLGELNGPVIIHHAVGDTSTDHANSENLAEALRSSDHAHTLHSYESDKHFFEGGTRALAADRDAEFFRSLQDATPPSGNR